MQKKIAKEVESHKFIYLILGIILIGALFVRIYRVDKVLGFYFDQGRDALVIWDLIKSQKLFLIGPTTGLPGIFRGPYYYYLIAPFYFLGKGNPVWPANFLSLTSVISVGFIYYLGVKVQDRITGIIAALIASFSFYIVYASRWLSNPTPMLILSMILIFAMFKALEGKKWSWPIISLVYGLSLFSFGSSGEFFYTFSLIVFLIWVIRKQGFGKKTSSLDIKTVLISGFLFVLTFAPLVLFDFKHEHILLNNFVGTFGDQSQGGGFKLPTLDFIRIRNESYFDIFTNKIFQDRKSTELLILLVTSVSFLAFLPKLFRNEKARVVLLLLISPIIGLYFYQGNYGNLYDYYMTGYYLIFILLFAIVLGKIWKLKLIGPLFVGYFVLLFLQNNMPVIQAKYSDGCTGHQSICFINQKDAINWIYNDAGSREFNVDVYVPPVIPYAYNYLLKWKENPNLKENQVKTLYTLYEIDPPHPERLEAWLNRQKGIGKVEETKSFGGITVERRIRVEGNKK